MHTINAIEVLTVALLRFEDEYLLLHRSDSKRFAPGKWTGIGGHVEANEYASLREAALREVEEEAGLSEDDLRDFVLRRALFVNRPGRPLGVVLYFTGRVEARVTPDCPEGTLHWKQAAEFDRLDIIDTTRQVFPLLIEDMERDPTGDDLPATGIVFFERSGKFDTVWWWA